MVMREVADIVADYLLDATLQNECPGLLELKTEQLRHALDELTSNDIDIEWEVIGLIEGFFYHPPSFDILSDCFDNIRREITRDDLVKKILEAHSQDKQN
jgi:hypothetical protein